MERNFSLQKYFDKNEKRVMIDQEKPENGK